MRIEPASLDSIGKLFTADQIKVSYKKYVAPQPERKARFASAGAGDDE
ncbi:hypothetical protein [Hydrocarboniphaga effusa]